MKTGKIKYRVRRQCGHHQTLSVFDSSSLQAWKTELEASECPQCWLKKQPPTFVRRTAQSGLFALDVMRGYPVRRELQERDYRFQRPRWMKWFSTESEREQEIAWARACGFAISGDE